MKRIFPIALVVAIAAVFSLSSHVDSARVAASTQSVGETTLPCGVASSKDATHYGLLPVRARVINKSSVQGVDATSGGSIWMN
jgi:hypothetical protein